MKYLKTIVNNSKLSNGSLILSFVIISFFYVFLEWLFLVTKPSFLTIYPFLDKLLILLFTSLLLSSLIIFVTTPVYLVKLPRVSSNLQIISTLAASIIPTALLASSVLLLIDNFSYTVFNFGIINISGVLKLIYSIGFIIIFFILFNEFLKFTSHIEIFFSKNISIKRIIACTLFVMSVSVVGFLLLSGREAKDTTNSLSSNGKLGPNVILITSESIDASHMSLYGYERKTTPFLEELSRSSLFAENAFSNAQGTTGSITSLLTGKHPTETRVIYAPDILTGFHSYQHLPGILKSNGYYTVQLSFNYYADAFDLNFQDGFNEVNGRYEEQSRIINQLNKHLPTKYSYFIYEISNRIIDRLRHIFFIKDMVNPFDQVTESMELFNDYEKLDYILSTFDNFADNNNLQPLFFHLHWMGTHGPKFYPKTQVFSDGQDMDKQGDYSIDFYDDAILEYDQAVSYLWNELESRNLDTNTVLVLVSDHSLKWSVSGLPFLIKFPDSDNGKVIEENIQNLDVAPTILDYLGIETPSWMSGQSLLEPVERGRAIFISVVGKVSEIDDVTGRKIHNLANPPFYQFGRISLVNCDNFFELNLQNFNFTQESINDYGPSICNQEDYITPSQALDQIIQFLKQSNFDTETLENVNIPE